MLQELYQLRHITALLVIWWWWCVHEHTHGCVHTKACVFMFVHTLVHQGLNPGLLHMLNMQSTMRAILPEIFLILHYDTILNVNTMPGTALTGW